MGGPYFWRGNHAYSLEDPGLKIELSAKAVSLPLWMLGERPVYRDNAVRDARTDKTLFAAKTIWACDAGVAVGGKGTLRFADGVREDLPLGEIRPKEYVEFLRVSETEYSIRVGVWATEYRYFLLDTARWTCIKI